MNTTVYSRLLLYLPSEAKTAIFPYLAVKRWSTKCPLKMVYSILYVRTVRSTWHQSQSFLCLL